MASLCIRCLCYRRGRRGGGRYKRILGASASLTAAVEDLALATDTDLTRWEDILRVQALVANTNPVFED